MKRKKVQSDFFIWDQSGPGIHKLSSDIKNTYQWYKKRKQEKKKRKK